MFFFDPNKMWTSSYDRTEYQRSVLPSQKEIRASSVTTVFFYPCLKSLELGGKMKKIVPESGHRIEYDAAYFNAFYWDFRW